MSDFPSNDTCLPGGRPESNHPAEELAALKLLLEQKEQAWAEEIGQFQEMEEAYQEVNRRNLESALKLNEREMEVMVKNQQLNEYTEELQSINANLGELNNKFRANEKELKYKNGLLNESVEQLKELVEAYEEVNQRNIESAAKLMDRERELQEKNALLAQVYRKVSESITYAERIQKAMLPPLEAIQQILPESFVFFRPRDVVSGDFYWMLEHNYKIFVVVGDCTGHGVPGAFMSTIGMTMLYDILNIMGGGAPDEILQILDSRLRLLLRQAEGKNSDGMEISICVIDKAPEYIEAMMKPRKVVFASAGGALKYFSNGQLHVVQGNKNSVGQKFKGVPSAKFHKHVIEVDAMSTFYLASDGFQDQLGGDENRRFLRKRFEELLQTTHTLPMDQQPAFLESNLRAWQGKERQTDDIVVIGFRLDK